VYATTVDAAPVDTTTSLAEVRSVVRKHAGETDREASFPEEALAALRGSGLLGLLVPASYGGMGATVPEMLKASAELARDCLSVGMIFTMHCQQVAALVRYASPRLRAAVLPRVARGEVYLGSVTTDQGSGGNLLSASSGLTADASTLRVDRFAPVVTGGMHADGFLITMRAPGTSSTHEVSLVYADRDQLDATVVGSWNPMGMRATHSVPMKLVGDIPVDQLLGEHGTFRHIALHTFAPLAHLGWASCWLGAADGALARTVQLLRAERDRRDLGSELLLHRLSRARQRLDTVYALVRHASDVLADAATDVSTPPVQLLLNAVKITSSEQCPAAVDELVELVGLRHGYLRDSELALERVLRDLRSASLNYSNDRLHAADGALTLMDKEVRHV
jgi:acyl-CoA dehydrogenase